MKKQVYTLFSVLLVALVLTNCATEDPLIAPIKKGISSQNYDAALSAADSAITTQPDNANGYYYKGLTLSIIAENTDEVTARKPYYADMYTNLVKARELYSLEEKPADEAGQIENIIMGAWSNEHNASIPYINNDSVMASVDNPFEVAESHLINAITANPDSSISYEILGRVYYRDGKFAEAIEVLNKAIEIDNPGSAPQYDLISTSYLQLKDYEGAVQVLEEGLELYPDTVYLVQKIADAYFQTGRTDQAMDVMNQLVESDPNNAQYRLVIGSQIYQQVLNLNDSLAAGVDSLYQMLGKSAQKATFEKIEKELEPVEAEIDRLTNIATNELDKAAELKSDNPSTFNLLGVIYQNKAAALFDKRNLTLDNDEADAYDAQAKEVLKLAMVNYEKAAELDPENTRYWETLSRVYTTLDMMDKAEEAMNKAGL